MKIKLSGDHNSGSWLRECVLFFLMLQLVTCLLYVAAWSPEVPYNFRELFGERISFFIALALAMVISLGVGPPALFGILLMRLPARVVGWAFPLALIGHGVLSYIGLRLVVPLESIHDIVGNPVWGWHDEFERGLRFIALNGFISLFIAGGSAAVDAVALSYKPAVFLRWIAALIVLLPLCYLLIVTYAATDNLVELLSYGGNGFSMIMLGLWIWIIALGATLLSARMAGPLGSRTGILLLLLLMLPLGYGLLTVATNASIEKYGARFSALQFLLSPNRDRYADGSELMLRYMVAHAAAQLLLAVAQFPLWRWLLRANRAPIRRYSKFYSSPAFAVAGFASSTQGGMVRDGSAQRAERESPKLFTRGDFTQPFVRVSSAQVSFSQPIVAPAIPDPQRRTSRENQADAITHSEAGRFAQPDVSEKNTKNAVKIKRAWLALCILYLGFVVYGSLVPLRYQYISLNLALDRFAAIPFLDLGIGSRADWVANGLLFIPLTFLWSGQLWPGGRLSRILMSIALFCAAGLLSAMIEFTQLYFPQRTVSQNDIFAECVGGLVGILVWWRWGDSIRQWFQQWTLLQDRTGFAETLLWGYLAGLFVYNLLPLDLTISPVEIYHKWRQGKIYLMPFAHHPLNPMQWAYDLGTDMVIWCPVGFLWVAARLKTKLEAWIWSGAAALLLEMGQLFVYSRVSDTTDIVTALLGAAIGIGLASRVSTSAQVGQQQLCKQTRWALPLGILWILVLMGVFWYPFNGRFEPAFLHQRMRMLYDIPFTTYYFGSEFRAATSMLHQLLFYLPLGVCCRFWVMDRRARALQQWAGTMAMAVMVLLPFGIEFGQVAIPGKFPSSTDWFLALLAETAAYWLAGRAMLLSRRT